MLTTKYAAITALLFACFVPATFAAETAGKCNPKDKNQWEWIFNFPQPNEQGKVLTVTAESLQRKENLNPKYADWVTENVALLATLDELPNFATELVLYRDCEGGIHFEATEVRQEQGVKRVTKVRKTLTLASSFGAPIILTAATGGWGALKYTAPMLIAGVPALFTGWGRGNRSSDEWGEFQEVRPGINVRTRPGFSEAKIE